VDRGVLDGALAAGFDCGGWCPEGRLAEDGRIPEAYPLEELAGGGYPERTERNVLDTGGTVVLRFRAPSPGTELTARVASRNGRPLLSIDGTSCPPEAAARRVAEFVRLHRIVRLNLAGPRASEAPGGYAYALRLVRALALELEPGIGESTEA